MHALFLCKIKKGIIITNGFRNILNESNRKPNKIWLDEDSEFYNWSMKSWLEKKFVEMYSIYDEGISVVAERFIRTLKNGIHECMTSVSEIECAYW